MNSRFLAIVAFRTHDQRFRTSRHLLWDYPIVVEKVRKLFYLGCVRGPSRDRIDDAPKERTTTTCTRRSFAPSKSVIQLPRYQFKQLHGKSDHWIIRKTAR
jgi:hypothetical protein